MEEAKDLVRTKAALIEQRLKLLHECQVSGADYKPLVDTVKHDLAELKEALSAMQAAAKSRLAKSLTDQYRETYNSLKCELETLVRLLEESSWKKQLLGSGQSTVDDSFSSLLVREDRVLDSSLSMTSGILQIASDVRSSLSSQRRRLEGVGSKVVRFAETLPGVNVLLRKVSRRQRLNAVVVSVAVAVCVCVILYLTLG
jgi:hypothetical protein